MVTLLCNSENVGLGRQKGKIVAGALHGLAEILFGDDVISREDRRGTTARNLSSHVRVDACSHHITNGRTPADMRDRIHFCPVTG
jgi:hypothetical protein